jgi:hypothetical protein
MAKPRAQGADVVTLIAKESVYGTPPAGNWRRMPLRSDDVSAAQGLEDDPTWNLPTADDGDPSSAAMTVAGDMVFPMDVRGLGVLMTMALGASTVVETTPDVLWTHTWKSGGDLFTYSKQVGHPKLTTPKYRTQAGLKSNGFSFPMARNGRALLTMPFIAQGEIKDVASRDPTPDAYAYLPFDNATGGVKIDGVVLASLTGMQLNFSNSLEAVETIREDMKIDGADETRRTCSGTANLRFGSDETIDDLVDDKTPCELTFSFKLQAQPTWTFIVTLHRVFFEKTKQSIGGPGGIEQPTAFRAAYDETAGCMMTVTLANDVETYN